MPTYAPLPVRYAGSTRPEPEAGTLFHVAFSAIMAEHGDTWRSLASALAPDGPTYNALRDWAKGIRLPWYKQSIDHLARIERYYHLPESYFVKIIIASRPTYNHGLYNPNPFQAALVFQMRKHGDSCHSLIAKAVAPGCIVKRESVSGWKNGRSKPTTATSFRFLEQVELIYHLPPGYFTDLLQNKPDSPLKQALRSISNFRQAEFRWHVPENFDAIPVSEQRIILQWINKNVFWENRDYSKYMRNATHNPYTVLFPNLVSELGGRRVRPKVVASVVRRNLIAGKVGAYGSLPAPPRLASQMEEFVSSKIALLAPPGRPRTQRWSLRSANRAVRNYGALFGALAAAPLSSAQGLGLLPERLGFGLLVFPGIIDWYLLWRQKRRGFFNQAETDFLTDVRSLVRPTTGWLRQNPQLKRHLRAIPGLISLAELTRAREDWNGACDRISRYAADRAAEIGKSTQQHRDPFEAIRLILDNDSPLREYRKIPDEIFRRIPDRRIYPMEAALEVRAYLLVRFAMQTGFRQRNLRELLICPRGHTWRTNAVLESLQRGELRWDDESHAWEVYLPAVAFKNSRSSFFMGKPYRLLLADLENLYDLIHEYMTYHRPFLLAGYDDPGTFFVRTTKSGRRTEPFDIHDLYETWSKIIRRHGIYNPFTGRGAIKGLLPHGPHSVRDVIAVHILKRTGSYELAGFAIQDTAETVRNHYVRFQPHQKAAIGAQIVNEVWQ